MNDYLFVGSDGALYDTRKADWHNKPLREGFKRGFPIIENLSQVKACLRAGKFTDLGGYPLYFITQDGAALSFEAVKENFEQVVWDFLNDASTGWRIVACEINYEDDGLTCAHTGEKIPSAYGEDD